MKRIYYLIIATVLFSCNQNKEIKYKHYPFTIIQRNGSGFSRSYAYLECDSFQFESRTIINAWIDGTKMKIIADDLRVRTNSNN